MLSLSLLVGKSDYQLSQYAESRQNFMLAHQKNRACIWHVNATSIEALGLNLFIVQQSADSGSDVVAPH